MRKYQLLTFISLCEFEKMIKVRLINPVEDVTVYNGMSLRKIPVAGSTEIVAMNRVIAHQPDHPQGQVVDKKNVKEVMK